MDRTGACNASKVTGLGSLSVISQMKPLPGFYQTEHELLLGCRPTFFIGSGLLHQQVIRRDMWITGRHKTCLPPQGHGARKLDLSTLFTTFFSLISFILFISLPEHEVFISSPELLWSVVVRRSSSSVVCRPPTFDVYALESTCVLQIL